MSAPALDVLAALVNMQQQLTDLTDVVAAQQATLDRLVADCGQQAPTTPAAGGV